jgi:multidrug efflux pump subunit AcrA (membrane-fusion protein)
VRASDAGVVEAIAVTNGSWVDERTPVLGSVRPERVRFRARGLQGDLGRLRAGLAARVTPPAGGSIEPGAVMEGTLEIGLTADPDERTVDLILTPEAPAAWARAGVSGFLEVEAAGGRVDLAIPLSSVVRDGLTPVIFRRDPRNADQVIRVEADLGIDDGRWVAIRSGVREGDEVVLEGVYQLMLATSGTAARGGHFHSDGTFHAGDDEGGH